MKTYKQFQEGLVKKAIITIGGENRKKKLEKAAGAEGFFD